MSFVSENLRRLIGKPILIGSETEVKTEAYIAGIGETKGWLIFNANGTISGKVCNKPVDCEIWEPENDFPTTKCATKFNCLIFEEKNFSDYCFDEFSFPWQFVDKEDREIIDGIIDRLLEKSGAKTELLSL